MSNNTRRFRLGKIESTISKKYIDRKLISEYFLWSKEHPVGDDFHQWIDQMPRHLRPAFSTLLYQVFRYRKNKRYISEHQIL